MHSLPVQTKLSKFHLKFSISIHKVFAMLHLHWTFLIYIMLYISYASWRVDKLSWPFSCIAKLRMKISFVHNLELCWVKINETHTLWCSWLCFWRPLGYYNFDIPIIYLMFFYALIYTNFRFWFLSNLLIVTKYTLRLRNIQYIYQHYKLSV